MPLNCKINRGTPIGWKTTIASWIRRGSYSRTPSSSAKRRLFHSMAFSPIRGFYVFKLFNTATTVKHKLAYVIPSADHNRSNLYYNDSEIFNVPANKIPMGVAASGKNFKKPWVKATVEKEVLSLRERLVDCYCMPLQPVRASAHSSSDIFFSQRRSQA